MENAILVNKISKQIQMVFANNLILTALIQKMVDATNARLDILYIYLENATNYHQTATLLIFRLVNAFSVFLTI